MNTLLEDLLANPILAALRQAAGSVQVHVVGGAVRDALLGRHARDLDVTLASHGAAIARRLAESEGATLVPIGGERFASYRVVTQHGEIDLWDREGGPLGPDLERRDLTIHAIAVDLTSGETVDPTGGEADIGARVLRAPRDDAFDDDPLRCLRLVRFAARLQRFSVERRTAALALEASWGLADVAPERVRVELELLLDAPLRALAAGLLRELSAQPGLWRDDPPDANADMPADRPQPDLRRRLAALETALAEARQALPKRPADDAAARWAVLLGTLAEMRRNGPVDELQRVHGEKLVSRATVARVQPMLVAEWPDEGIVSGRRFLHVAGRAWASALAAAATRHRPPPDPERLRAALLALDDLARTDPGIFDPPALLTGEDVQRLLGISPGPAVGAALYQLRRAQIDGDVTTPEQAVRFIKSLE